MKVIHSPGKTSYSLKKEFKIKNLVPIVSKSLEKKAFTSVGQNLFGGLVLQSKSEQFKKENKISKDKDKIRNTSSKNQLKNEKDKKEKEKQLKRKLCVQAKNFVDSKLEKKLQSYFLFLSLSRRCLKAPKAKKFDDKYLVFVGKGNNSKMLKKIFSWRHWWKITNNPQAEGINLIWTQWSKKIIFDKIPVHEKGDQDYGKQKIVCLLNSANQTNKKLMYLNQYNILLSKKQRDPSKLCYIQTEFDLKNYLKNQYRKIREQKGQLLEKKQEQSPEPKKQRINFTYNHIEGHEDITDKKNLFHNLTRYCTDKNLDIFDITPLTYHINGEQKEYEQIIKKQEELNGKNMWILKPGQKSNRGNGIKVFKKVEQIKQYIQKQKKSEKHPNRTYIIQKYINPALFHRRKFDIRCFVLVVASPKINAYFYQEGYLRTASRQFKDKKCDDKFMHLTNDAIQKKATDYGKFEKGNKVNFEEYQNYLDLFEKKKDVNFKNCTLPLLKLMAARSIASGQNFNISNKSFSFELMGYDFMLDEDYKPWLIEVNTNPSLQVCCPLLESLIPNLINNVLKIAVDSIFKPPKVSQWPLQSIITFPEQILQLNKFELIYTQNDC